MAQVVESGKLPKYSYIPDLNKEIAKMVKSLHSKQVVLVNQSKGFDWKTMTIADKVHPNQKGVSRWLRRGSPPCESFSKRLHILIR